MKTKKLRAMALILAFTACFSSVVPAEAGTGKAERKKWAAAYQKTVKKLNKEDPNGQSEDLSDFSNRPYTYDLIYFDNDNIPELVAGYDGYWVSMYTYDPELGKVYQVIDYWPYNISGNVGYKYLPKKNFLKNYNNYNNAYPGLIISEYCGKMKNHKIVSRYSKDLRTQNYKDKNNNGMPDEGEYPAQASFYYGNKKISAKKYASYTKASEKFKLIIGTMTFKQIRKKLKSYQ